jgi:hypothetical protein
MIRYVYHSVMALAFNWDMARPVLWFTTRGYAEHDSRALTYLSFLQGLGAVNPVSWFRLYLSASGVL